MHVFIHHIVHCLPFIPQIRNHKLINHNRIEATVDTSGKKDKILVKILVDPAASKGVDLDAIKETVKSIGKQKGKKKDVKVKAEISQLP